MDRSPLENLTDVRQLHLTFASMAWCRINIRAHNRIIDQYW